jgi:hypothetical protein
LVEQSERAIAFARASGRSRICIACASSWTSRAPVASAPAKRTEPRAFVTSNGVGLLPRVSWRSPGDCRGDGTSVRDHEPAFGVGGNFGYLVEYIPSMFTPNAIPTTGRVGSAGSSIRMIDFYGAWR